MDLQDHPALQAGLGHPLVHADHRQFDDVGRSALDGRVHGVPFCQRAHSGVLRVDVRQEAPAAEQRLHVPVLTGEADAVVDERPDGREGGEVSVDQVLGFLAAQMQALREAEGRDAVHNAEVRRLGPSTLLPRHFGQRNAVDLRRGGGMDVVSVAEGLHEVSVLAEVRHDAELDLRVVRGDDDALRRARDERLADLLAAFGADGDVLQVRIRAGQAAGGRKRLVERRMDTAIHRRDVGRERLDVGR